MNTKKVFSVSEKNLNNPKVYFQVKFFTTYKFTSWNKAVKP